MVIPLRIGLIEERYPRIGKPFPPLDILPPIERNILAEGMEPEKFCGDAEVTGIREEVLAIFREEAVSKLCDLRISKLYATFLHPSHRGSDGESRVPCRVSEHGIGC